MGRRGLGFLEFGILEIGVAALLLFGLTSPSAAQSTNASPVIVLGSNEVDPAALPFLTDEARQSFASAIADMKSGVSVAHVMSASPNKTGWSSRQADKTTFVSLEDLARQSLETCEYYAKGPCLILSINGRDARDANGGWPLQPRMLADEPGVFDAMRLPFTSLANREYLRGYQDVAAPRALVLTTSGGGLWRQGDTIFQAIVAAQADCEKTFAGQLCLLYAVNDRVVFAQ